MSKHPTKKQVQKKKLAVSISITVFILAVIAFYTVITQSGHWLVDDDEFDHVNWVVILDGQSADMERSDFAAGLLANNKADSVLILGRRIFRNRTNAEFYLDDFMKLGDFDSNAVFIARHDDPSTIGEAYTIIPWLKKHKADTVLLLTSAASTYRVKNIFQKLSGERPVFLTKDIHHYQYNADSWYTSRELRKEWLRGWTALFASYIDLLPAGNLSASDSFYFKPILSAKEFEAEKNPVFDLQALLPGIEDKQKGTASIDTDAQDSSTRNLYTKDTSSKEMLDKEKDVSKGDSVKTDGKNALSTAK